MWSKPFQRSIADYAAQPQNNYLLMRLVAALMVIYGHSYAITKLPGQADLLARLLRFTYAGALGVAVFFVISGFLVTASYLNRRHWGEFMQSRCLRVFPGLIVCLLAMMFLLGPAVTRHGLGDYFSDPQLYLAPFGRHFRLPGVFEQLPQDGVNGSLWTLPLEFSLYVVLGIFGVVGLLFRRGAYSLVVLALCVLALLAFDRGGGLFTERHAYLNLILLFAAGSVIRLYAERIPLHWAGLVALALPALLLYHTRFFPVLFTLWLVYMVFWVAYVPDLHWFNRAGDYSYGLYIYAFPIAQTLRQYIPDITPLGLFASASLLTLGCAMLSWHLIEAPALKLKDVDFRAYFRRRAAET
jgi:peptidoglycan/LPS O-acetylase OafA/YrhL